MANNVDDIYGTDPQVEFARKMAEALLSGKGGFKGLPADVATLPYAGVNYGGMNILNAIQGAQYRDIAGSQDKNLNQRLIPGNEGLKAPVTLGTGVSRTQGQRQASLAPPPGMFPPPVTPGQGGKIGESETPPTGLPPLALLDDSPKSASIYDALVNEVKKSENMAMFNGKETQSKAYKDYSQYSNGYGTKATHKDEIIDKDEAERRFTSDWSKAERVVDGFKPGLDPGTRAALVSLTYNSGPGWRQGALGKAIREGNLQKAQEIFKQYNRAGGKVNPVLIARRDKESKWFGQGKEEPSIASPMPELRGTIPPNAVPLDKPIQDTIEKDTLKTGGIPPAEGAPVPPVPNMPAPGPQGMGFGPPMSRTAALPPAARPSISDVSPQGAYPVPEFTKTPEPIIPKTLIDQVPQPPVMPASSVPAMPDPGPRDMGFAPPGAMSRQAAKLPVSTPGIPGALVNSPREATSAIPPGVSIPESPAGVERAQSAEELGRNNDKLEDMLNKMPNVPPSSRGSPPPGIMRLGGPENLGAEGPPAGPSPAPGQQFAQARPYQAEQARPAQDNNITIPGYSGPAPPVMPAWTDEMLLARLNRAPDSERNDILKQYHDSLAPKGYDVPGGRLMAMPQRNGPTQFMFLPHGETEPGKLIPRADKPGLNYSLTVPGDVSTGEGRLSGRKVTEPETGMETLARDKAQLDTETEVTKTLGAAKAKDVASTIERGMTAGPVLKTIDTMDAISKASKNIPRGPTSPFMTAVRQFADNFNIPIPKDTPEGEVLQKLNAGLASQATRAISNRGTNFELETFIKNNPGLLQTKEGMEMLLDIMRQEYKSYQDIARIANRTKGKDVDIFYDKVDEYYDKNPAKFSHKMEDGSTVRVTTRKIRSEADIEKYVEPGEGWITSKGKIGVRK